MVMLEAFTEYYFSKVLLFSSVSVALFYGLRKKNSNQVYTKLNIYLSAELFLGILYCFIEPFEKEYSDLSNIYVNITNATISLLEFLFISHLYIKIFSNTTSIRIIKILQVFVVLFFATICVYPILFNIKYLEHITYAFGSIEFLFIFFLSISYLKHVFSETSHIPLIERGAFWCFLGFLFYCSISAPFYIICPSFFPTEEATIDEVLPALFYYLPYSILFVCITISLRCKTQIWN